MTAAGMAAAAWLISLGMNVADGFYSRPGLVLVSLAIVVCAATLWGQHARAGAAPPPRLPAPALAAALVVEIRLLVASAQAPPRIQAGILVVGAIALLQAIDLARWRAALFALAAILFGVVASAAMTPDPRIDVFSFQQMSANALLHGRNPYTVTYPNLYAPTTPFYGPGIVDPATNTLTAGFPYPPFSLLLALPSYALAGDVRFADIAAIVLTAVLLAAARPGRWNGLVAASFLLTPDVFFLVSSAWTEALLAFVFSLVMVAAMRYRAALPFALGALFATKQTSILAAPLVWLLLGDRASIREYVSMMMKAAAVAIAITAPFFLWNPAAFWRAVVEFQFIQPFRIDALSHLVWMHNRLPLWGVVRWTPFALIAPATAYALWRADRSPSGFAAAFTLVTLTFVAFNKQAFYNYYYFTAATAWWAAAATGSRTEATE